jgi:hypothetical protein
MFQRENNKGFLWSDYIIRFRFLCISVFDPITSLDHATFTFHLMSLKLSLLWILFQSSLKHFTLYDLICWFPLVRHLQVLPGTFVARCNMVIGVEIGELTGDWRGTDRLTRCPDHWTPCFDSSSILPLFWWSVYVLRCEDHGFWGGEMAPFRGIAGGFRGVMVITSAGGLSRVSKVRE